MVRTEISFVMSHNACVGHATSGWSTSSRCGEDCWHEGTTKTTVRVDNEVEAHREANNYKVSYD